MVGAYARLFFRPNAIGVLLLLSVTLIQFQLRSESYPAVFYSRVTRTDYGRPTVLTRTREEGFFRIKPGPKVTESWTADWSHLALLLGVAFLVSMALGRLATGPLSPRDASRIESRNRSTSRFALVVLAAVIASSFAPLLYSKARWGYYVDPLPTDARVLSARKLISQTALRYDDRPTYEEPEYLEDIFHQDEGIGEVIRRSAGQRTHPTTRPVEFFRRFEPELARRISRGPNIFGAWGDAFEIESRDGERLVFFSITAYPWTHELLFTDSQQPVLRSVNSWTARSTGTDPFIEPPESLPDLFLRSTLWIGAPIISLALLWMIIRALRQHAIMVTHGFPVQFNTKVRQA